MNWVWTWFLPSCRQTYSPSSPCRIERNTRSRPCGMDFWLNQHKKSFDIVFFNSTVNAFSNYLCAGFAMHTVLGSSGNVHPWKKIVLRPISEKLKELWGKFQIDQNPPWTPQASKTPSPPHPAQILSKTWLETILMAKCKILSGKDRNICGNHMVSKNWVKAYRRSSEIWPKEINGS